MDNLGIIVIGYNRLDSISRLLERLNICDYFGDEVKLIISLDNCGQDHVVKFAKQFKWKHGEKIVCTFAERQGLRKHVLKCGNYINDYDLRAAAVFEDDVYPSLGFYNFMRQAIKYYEDDTSIGGISLYKHEWNIHANLPFLPNEDGKHDVFFLQMAQSWGQIWTKNQWNEFYEWYKIHDSFAPQQEIPFTYFKWPDTSWLKYHNWYCIETQKYFVYPNKSLTTCFADAGEHAISNSSVFQIPIEENTFKQYSFNNVETSMSVYDCYFESVKLKQYLEQEYVRSVTIDFYAQKVIPKGGYLLSSDVLPYQIIKTYGMDLRPWEKNIYNAVPGKSIKLYDLTKKAELLGNKKTARFGRWVYLQKQIPDWNLILKLIIFKIRYKVQLIKKKR